MSTITAEYLHLGDSVEQLSSGFHWLQVMTKSGQGAHIGFTINADRTATIHVDTQEHGPHINPTFFTSFVEGWDEYSGLFPEGNEGIKDITVRPNEGDTVIGIQVWDPDQERTIGNQVIFDDLNEYALT